MKKKIFINGSEGTTGLRIFERLGARDDIEMIKIDPELRKDPEEQKKRINQSDITFLCLPDAASREAVAMVENENVVIIDASTAHRTLEGWAYGFPELSKAHREKIKTAKRIAVPGCFASGFTSIVYPLVAGGILPKDYPVSCFAISGYSGAGKKTIAVYEGADRPRELSSGREYALTQQHKHLKEMKAVPGLLREPLFSPIVADYYSGMVVTLPIYSEYLKNTPSPEELWQFFAEFYQGEQFIQVMPFGSEGKGMMAGNACAGWDGLKIYVTGNAERVTLHAQFDNLGKGASGAAIQCLNIMLGCEESRGLNL